MTRRNRDKSNRRPVGYGWGAALAGIGSLLLLALITWSYSFFHQTHIAPQQPIPFSHRVHAQVKKISCLLCHENARSSARSGVPPLETCMLCHSRIIINYPPIETLRRHYFEQEPILWEKIYSLPDFVYFNHAIHLNRSIDCSRCHGNVSLMDRVAEVIPHTMGFCIGCHRETGATVDCFTCHR